MRETSCCLFLKIAKLMLLKYLINSTSRYKYALLNSGNPYFEQMVSQIYTELQLNKANSIDNEAPFWTWNCP